RDRLLPGAEPVRELRLAVAEVAPQPRDRGGIPGHSTARVVAGAALTSLLTHALPRAVRALAHVGRPPSPLPRAYPKPCNCGAGDRILYQKYTGQEVTVDKEEYIVIRFQDVLAKLEETNGATSRRKR